MSLFVNSRYSKLRRRSVRPRVCARLDLKGSVLVKGVSLEGLSRIGNPNPYLHEYFRSGIDEIHIWNTISSLFRSEYIGDTLKYISSNVFVPLSAGGGISDLEQIRYLLSLGCDKVILNSAAVLCPSFLEEAVSLYGVSSISVAIDTLADSSGTYKILIHSGRTDPGILLSEWIHTVQSIGVADIILTSITHEGACNGYDLRLVEYVSNLINIPLVIHGGASSPSHILEICKFDHISGASAASLFHFNTIKSNPELLCDLTHHIASRPIIDRLDLTQSFDLSAFCIDFRNTHSL